MPYVNCPVFIIHGTQDKLVPIEQAEDLYSRVENKYKPFYVQNAGHNNIEYSLKFKGDYLSKVKGFVRNVIGKQKKMSLNKLLRKNTAKYWNEKFEHFYYSLHPVVRHSLPTISNSMQNSQNFVDHSFLKS